MLSIVVPTWRSLPWIVRGVIDFSVFKPRAIPIRAIFHTIEDVCTENAEREEAKREHEDKVWTGGVTSALYAGFGG